MNVAKAKFLVVRRHWTQMGEKQEQERIIKLLEARILQNIAPDIHSYELLHNQLVNKLIALIKGHDK